MFMTAIDLETSDLSTERTIYTQTLGLPLRQATTDSFTVQAGTTALTFRSSSQQPLLYHFAFTVPLNKWKQAKAWLGARTPLLEGEGEDEFESAGAHALVLLPRSGGQYPPGSTFHRAGTFFE